MSSPPAWRINGSVTHIMLKANWSTCSSIFKDQWVYSHIWISVFPWHDHVIKLLLFTRSRVVNLSCFALLTAGEGGAGAQHRYWKWRVCFHRGAGGEFFSRQRPGLWGTFLQTTVNVFHLLTIVISLLLCFDVFHFDAAVVQVLLVTSSFMSPTESRNGTNMNRVRFFGTTQLQKSPAQEKWDRVKIVCSQPYSKVRAHHWNYRYRTN